MLTLHKYMIRSLGSLIIYPDNCVDMASAYGAGFTAGNEKLSTFRTCRIVSTRLKSHPLRRIHTYHTLVCLQTQYKIHMINTK